MQPDNKRITNSKTNGLEIRKEKSAVVLTTKYLPCLNTLKMVLQSDCVVTGVVFCDQIGVHYRIVKEIKRIRKYGFLKRLSQITVSLIHHLVDATSDREVWENLYGDITVREVIETLEQRRIPYIETSAYESHESLTFLKSINPEFFVCHTPYWVKKCVRDIPKERVSIGSHPGIVPYYRGAHSAFWCMFDGNSALNGYSIFCLDEGVDSGPLIERKKIEYRKDISFRANDLFLLSLISKRQAKIVEKFSQGAELNRVHQEELDPKQARKAPGLIEYYRFRKMLADML